MKTYFAQNLGRKLGTFFEGPISPVPLGVFRILIALFLLIQAAFWFPDWLAFMGPEGWLQWEISSALSPDWLLHAGTVYERLAPAFLSPEQFVWLLFWVYALAGFGLLLGWHTRYWAILAWLIHYVILSTLRTFTYGVDIFLHIALFYLVVMPVANLLSLDVKQGRKKDSPSWAVTLSIRALQIHLCLIYLSAGFEKALSPEWWGGNVLWRSLVQPDFRQFDFTWLANVPWVAIGLSWFTICVECLYGVAMWIPKVRMFWLAGIISLHLGIGIFLGLWLFGLIMIVLSVSAFGPDAWRDFQTIRDKWIGSKGRTKIPTRSPESVLASNMTPSDL